jgi:transposase
VAPRVPGEPSDHALGRSRGGFGTKVHLVTDGTGLPLAVEVSPGQAHESKYVEPVLNAVRIERLGGGRPRQRPAAVAGDKGYSYPGVRAWLRAHHIHPIIPERDDQREQRAHRPGRKPAFDRVAYRRRNVLERAGGLLKEARAIATRFDKLATQYLATLKLGILELYLHATLANTP